MAKAARRLILTHFISHNKGYIYNNFNLFLPCFLILVFISLIVLAAKILKNPQIRNL